MRKINLKNTSITTRYATQPATDVLQRKMNSDQSPSLSRVGNLEMFHDQLLLKQKHLLSNVRRAQSTLKADETKELWRKKSLHKDFSRATEALNQMRRELSHKKNQIKQDIDNNKLNRFIDNLQKQLEEKRYNRLMQPPPPPPPPVYYPIPMPFPMYNNQNSELPYINQSKTKNLSEYTRSSFNSKYNNESFYQRNSRNHGQSKGVRLKKNKRRFKKVVNAILFTIYFNNFCKKMRQLRRINFNKIQPSFQSSLKQVTDSLRKVLKPFYSLLFTKRQISYDIQQNQNQSIIKGKVESVRKFVQMILEIAKKWMQVASFNRKYVQLFYYLCRHGNYCCSIPILTPQQLQLTCISPKFNYISSDCNLQNAAFINLYFIKIIIYNILLCPQKLSSQFEEQILSNNLYVISSVVYELMIEMQDQYMLDVHKSYQIGNYEKVRGVQVAEPLLYKNAVKTEGDLISGLKSEELTRKFFDVESWNTEKKQIKETIDIFHKTMVKYHELISKRCF